MQGRHKLDIRGTLQYNNTLLDRSRMRHFKHLTFLPLVSGFRLSLGQRLLALACLVVPLWAAVAWAIR
jgi:hypothetical protein